MFDLILITIILVLHFFTNFLLGGGPGLCLIFCCCRIFTEILFFIINFNLTGEAI